MKNQHKLTLLAMSIASCFHQSVASTLADAEVITKTAVPNLYQSEIGTGTVYAVSGNGKVAGGERYKGDFSSGLEKKAIIWSNHNNNDYADMRAFEGENYTKNVSFKKFNTDGSILLTIQSNKTTGNPEYYVYSGENYANVLQIHQPYIRDMSSDGKVLGGYTIPNTTTGNSSEKAAVFTGTNYETVIDLSENIIYENQTLAASSITALNKTGNVAGGLAGTVAVNNNKIYTPVIWYGENYATRKVLPTSFTTTRGKGHINALNDLGDIAGGYIGKRGETTGKSQRAAIWRGTDYASLADLGTLKSDDSGRSEVNDLTGDGVIAAGWAESDNARQRPTLWAGTNHKTKLDLGTLKQDKTTGIGIVY